MNRALKPLFRPEVIRDQLKHFHPATDLRAARASLMRLAETIARPAPGTPLNEENLKPALFADVFCGVLGYQMVALPPAGATLVPEFPIPAGRGIADAAIGRAPSPSDLRSVFAAVEVKGPRDPLDIPHGGRRLSAVEQGFDYAINLGCDWIIVSSMVETRLYYKGADRFTCERFELERLATSDDHLRRFLFILGAERVAPPTGRPHLYDLYERSRTVGDSITRSFYTDYSHMRSEAFASLTRANPTVDAGALLTATQKVLDRILFCAFAEDRGLLPRDTIRDAFIHSDPYNPRPRWENFLGLFRAINDGNPALRISRYNGGLFAPDPVLDSLRVPDEVCTVFKRLGDFDFSPLDPTLPDTTPLRATGESMNVDVEILGHIFEQSITDLERMRLEIEGRVEAPDAKQAKSRRKKEGAFYTPKFITRYIVEHALGPVLSERLEALRVRHHAVAAATARKALENPEVYDVDALNNPQREALIAFWLGWQEEIAHVRILDPACGSGAFLIEAFDQLQASYQAANERLLELRGQPELLDLNREILQRNLYGVDLNDEAVEICRLSLWIKTAEPGKILTDLDHTIRPGNSIIADPSAHPRAFDWQAAFPEVVDDGGFDVVVGNPPYIRQEWISPYKPYLKANYSVFSGTADLYLYFIERGLRLLRPGGRLGFITSGTFARVNSAGEYRQWLPANAVIESMVNLGDTRPFGPDVWAESPTITILQRNDEQRAFPYLFIHEDVPTSLEEAMNTDSIICDGSVFEETEWKFQPKDVTAIFRKAMATGSSLSQACKGRIYYGIKTGLNEAFIVDTPTRDRLVTEDPNSAQLLRRILKGEDLRPWYQDWEGRWLILMPSGWTRKQASHLDEAAAWSWMHSEHAPIAMYLEPFADAGRKRTDQGEFWWELRSCDYYGAFDAPKIFWPDIQKFPRFSWDASGLCVNDKGFLAIPPGPEILAMMHTRLSWFLITQLCVPLGVRAGLWRAQCKSQFMGKLPIPVMPLTETEALAKLAVRATSSASERYELHLSARRRITTDLAPMGAALNNALTEWWRLDFPTFRAELKKAFKTDIPVRERDDWQSALAQWRIQHDTLTAQLIAIEEEINDRTYRLFNLTPTEIRTLEDFQKRTKTFYPLGEV